MSIGNSHGEEILLGIIPQSMGIGNSHSEEILLGINTSHGDTQSLGYSSGDNWSDGEATNNSIKLLQQCENCFRRRIHFIIR